MWRFRCSPALVAAAQGINLSVDIEDVFNYPTLGEVADNRQEASDLPEPKDSASQVSILDHDTVGASATACQVECDMIEDVRVALLSCPDSNRSLGQRLR